jgi:pantoate ligase / CMP/dCMP kinase
MNLPIFTTPSELGNFRQLHPAQAIGFVPTMGALHVGHQSLIDRARRENAVVIVSIFVNPLQFGENEDLDRYPRQLEIDRVMCETAGVDALFVPTVDSIGINDSLTQVIPPAMMLSGLCGRTRQGHFEGVATIVTKLLNIVKPDRAYFGEKDAQQLAIIRRVVMDLNIGVDIIGCATVRADSGLAHSSRNQYLSPTGRAQAAVIYRSLQQAQKLALSGEVAAQSFLTAVMTELATVPEFQLEYLELVNAQTLHPIDLVANSALIAIAGRIENTRLIDNIVMSTSPTSRPTIAIDGPAGAGKSTITKRVADRLGLLFLDTGSMYRAIAWLVLEANLALDDELKIAELVNQARIVLTGERVVVNDIDVTAAIRTLEVTSKVSAIAALGVVRAELVKQQQAIGANGGIVAEGRDMCTHVFPAAQVKIFLTASVAERARRRQQDLISRGQGNVSLAELERTIAERDLIDSSREISPLKKADDAVEVISDNLTIDEVVDVIVNMYLEVES